MIIIWLLCLPFMLVSYALSGIAILCTMLGFQLFPWLKPGPRQYSPEEIAEDERLRSLSKEEKKAEVDAKVDRIIQRESNIWKVAGFVLLIVVMLGFLKDLLK